MEERVMQFRVGVLVVATVIITGILIVLFGEFPSLFNRTKTIYIRFPSAPGVMVNTPVRKSGVLVGRVSDVQLNDDGSVLVTVKLDAHRKVLENEVCRITTGNFLGDAMLEFVPATKPKPTRTPEKQETQTPADSAARATTTSPVALQQAQPPPEEEPPAPLADGAYLQGEVGKDALTAMSDALIVFTEMTDELEGTLRSIEQAGSDIGAVARNMNAVIVNNQDQLRRILSTTEQAVGRFDNAMASVDELVSDEELEFKLKDSLDRIPRFLEDASNLMVGLGRVALEAERNLQNLQGFTGPLGERGERIVTSFEGSVDRLDDVLQEVQVFAGSLNDNQGSLGLFLNDPELYQQLNHAAANIEKLTFRLFPVIENARVISDKLARNPSRLLRGALGKDSSGLK